MKKPRFNLTGITLIVFLGVFVVFIIFGSSIYQNIKKVEHNVFNLYQQVRTTNSKIDQFGVADEEMAQQSLKFTEATKNWQMYQNEEFGFQLKNPVSWGSLEYALSEQAEAGKHSSANFTHFRDGSPLRLAVTTYDYQAEAAVVNYANRELYNTLLHNKVGECNDKVFGVLNNLKIGEIRNCFVRENILKQKFILCQ